MIKLTVNPGSHPIIRIFHKNTVIIGSNPQQADLVISDVQETHVKILQDNEQFTIINLANDPYVTLNGLPFGKKILKHNDIVQIGSTSVLFEELANTPEKKTQSFLADTERKLPEILEKTLSPQPNLSEAKLSPYVDPLLEMQIPSDYPDDFEKQLNLELEQLNELSLHSDLFEEGLASYEDVEALIKRVEQLETEEASHHSLTNLEGAPIEKKPAYQDVHPLAEELSTLRIEATKNPTKETPASPKLSLKDYYLKDFEDESGHWEASKNPHIEVDPLSPKKWKLIFKIFFALMGIGIIAAGLLYLWVSDQSGEEEIRAAKGVADIAMALTYAQIKHITPQNQNWSDPEFVKNNLTAALASVYPSFACFDTHGQFNDCPYISRIYTSSDISKFLVIAQPAPSVFQWIIPKASIIVDSNAMEMRKITDLRSLNRLLVNSNTLDGVNAMEISQLIKQGELIPLSHLASKDENEGYNLPKALAYIHPGAQNLIYNAPRYYQLGQNLLQRARALNENDANSNEATLIQQEIASLAHFSDMVLYSADGMETAIQAQRALVKLVPNEKFIIAYLQFNSEGKVLNSHLIIDETNEIASASPTVLPSNDPLSEQAELDLTRKAEILIEKSDKSHAIYQQLLSLKNARQEALSPLSDQIISLLNSHNREVLPTFVDRFNPLFTQYQQISDEQEKKITHHLSEIYREHSDIPLTQFINLVKESGLEAILQDFLKTFRQNAKPSSFSHDDFEQQLKKIGEIKNWHVLHQQINEMTELLKLVQLSDPEMLATYQNTARSHVIQKLDKFLIMPDPFPQKENFNTEARNTLITILKTSWIYDHDAYDFYLNEFDLRYNQ